MISVWNRLCNIELQILFFNIVCKVIFYIPPFFLVVLVVLKMVSSVQGDITLIYDKGVSYCHCLHILLKKVTEEEEDSKE